MATARRQVKRAAGRQQIVGRYQRRAWYELPDWAKVWFADNIAWMVTIVTVILAPAAALAVVLGFYALPLSFLGIPGTANDVGLNVPLLLLKFGLLAMSIRPLFRRQERGLVLVMAAAVVHLVQSIYLQHAITGITLLIFCVYLFTQVRRNFIKQ